VAADSRADLLVPPAESAVTPLLAMTGPDFGLTPREREVAGLAAEGWSDARIAARLGVSVRTVETHLHRVYAKCGVAGRRELSDIRWR
jgi:DNA-binding CsgD family transcriptional regulator